MSDKIKHTRGPWRTQGWVPTWAYIPVHDADHNLVASLYPDGRHNYTREQVEANANLITAAPEMLSAIVEADGCFEAALCEGWIDALADGDIERIRDIWNRRLSLARSQFPAALAKAEPQS